MIYKKHIPTLLLRFWPEAMPEKLDAVLIRELGDRGHPAPDRWRLISVEREDYKAWFASRFVKTPPTPLGMSARLGSEDDARDLEHWLTKPELLGGKPVVSVGYYFGGGPVHDAPTQLFWGFDPAMVQLGPQFEDQCRSCGAPRSVGRADCRYCGTVQRIR